MKLYTPLALVLVVAVVVVFPLSVLSSRRDAAVQPGFDAHSGKIGSIESDRRIAGAAAPFSDPAGQFPPAA